MFLILMSLSHMNSVLCISNNTNQTEQITLFSLTKPMESGNVTENPCKDIDISNFNLSLTSMGLDVFPPCLSKKVEILDLSINNLTIIEEQDISELSDLRILILKHNKISQLYWKMEILPNLQILDLSYNQLATVPKCIKLNKMKWLSLAGNPISQIPPYAFSCFSNLEFLNLSSTSIGMISSEDISQLAFANKAMTSSSLHILDLSGTYIRSGNASWSKDLSSLKELHIMKMINMESLDEDLISSFPQIELMNCANSSSLTSVGSRAIENASKLKFLYLQNCNLSSLSPWRISSGYLYINIYGNPLKCNCGFPWFFPNHVNITLIRPSETFCFDAESGVRLPILAYNYQCLYKGTTTTLTDKQTISETNIRRKYFDISDTTEEPLNILQATSEQAVSSASTSQEAAKKVLVPESITVFKSKALDSDSTTPLANKQVTSTVVSPNVTSDAEAEEDYTLDITQSSISELPTAKITDTISATTKYSDLPVTDDHTADIKQATTNRNTHSAITEETPWEYEYEDDLQYATTTVKNTVIPCNYHPCTHLQRSCFELQQLTHCYCPGLSGEDIIPDPPRLRQVSEITDTSALIQWCAPNSIVENYRLLYHPEGSKNWTVIDNIYVTSRQYTLYNLLPYTTYEVCVTGLNKAGSSHPANDPTNVSRSPCAKFTTKPSYIVILVALSTLGGVFLLTIIILSVYLHKACKNNLLNHYDTHLISYKNPAFDYQLTIPTFH
ncbi:leucine-rich repeat neuronal protein 4 [Bombina bombina]|uniref:leucine-rich repeat neuronal protein 4 n=1 Tax=Bombina bombina TaxID=8345 RepID=UPI00235B08D7|nr:leucine-rich repeat neuronal protein 4 [Bombina bombina]